MGATVILVGPENWQRLELIRAAQAPRLDYHLVAQGCTGQVIECYPSPALLAGPKAARVVCSLSGNTVRAARLARALPQGAMVYSTGETWGLPMALVGGRKKRRAGQRHVVYVHRVYSRLWLCALRALRRVMAVDGWICATRRQAEVLGQALGTEHARVEAISQGVDTLFFDPARCTQSAAQPYVLSVGVEMRDYGLLFEAAGQFDMPVVAKTSSGWMVHQRRGWQAPPSNVTVVGRHVSYAELRELYGGAGMVVVPLRDTIQAAGISTILEAMAMGKCVIATRSRGLPDALVDGVTGVVVEPTAARLAEAICEQLGSPAESARLAENGYQWVREHVSLEAHAAKVVGFMANVLAAPGVLPQESE